MKLVRQGMIRDSKLTTKDFINCITSTVKIWQELEGVYQGKTPMLGKYIDEDITLDVDVMFCEGVSFLHGVVMPPVSRTASAVPVWAQLALNRLRCKHFCRVFL